MHIDLWVATKQIRNVNPKKLIIYGESKYISAKKKLI